MLQGEAARSCFGVKDTGTCGNRARRAKRSSQGRPLCLKHSWRRCKRTSSWCSGTSSTEAAAAAVISSSVAQAPGYDNEAGTAESPEQDIFKLEGIISQKRYIIDRKAGFMQASRSIAGIEVGNAAGDYLVAGADNFTGKFLSIQEDIHLIIITSISPAYIPATISSRTIPRPPWRRA